MTVHVKRENEITEKKVLDESRFSAWRKQKNQEFGWGSRIYGW
jgi:hypothetical protein